MTGVAVFTVVHQSPVILRKWVTHHAGLLGSDSVYVVAHGHCPGHRDIRELSNLITVPRRFGLDVDTERMAFVEDFAAGLLRYHDAVVYTDADELLLPWPDPDASLSDHLLADRSAVRAPLFFNIVPHPHYPAIDWTRPLLPQARGLSLAPRLCNPCVFYERPRLRGRHHMLGAPHRLDPGLLAFHLKYLDLALMGPHYEGLKGEIAAIRAAEGSDGPKLKGWSKGTNQMIEWARAMSRHPTGPMPDIALAAGHVGIEATGRGFRALGDHPREVWTIPDTLSQRL